MKLVECILLKSTKIEDKFQDLSIDSSNIASNIYRTVIKVMSLSEDYLDEEIQSQGNAILESLTNEKSISKLHRQFLEARLLELLPLLETEELDMGTEPILLLCGFLKICKFQCDYLETLKKCIQNVWKFSAIDAKIKVSRSIASAMMNWDDTMGTGQSNELEKFLNECISKHLKWSAGSGGEYIRIIAVCTLSAVAQGAPSVSKEILPKFLMYFPSLIRDNCVGIRLQSIKIFFNFGPIPMPQLLPIANGKRMTFFE